jgi:hypothetical protein
MMVFRHDEPEAGRELAACVMREPQYGGAQSKTSSCMRSAHRRRFPFGTSSNIRGSTAFEATGLTPSDVNLAVHTHRRADLDTRLAPRPAAHVRPDAWLFEPMAAVHGLPDDRMA